MTETKSISDLCREFIFSNKDNPDFKTAAGRTKLFAEHCKQPEFEKILDPKKHRAIMVNLLRPIAKELQVNVEDWGLAPEPEPHKVKKDAPQSNDAKGQHADVKFDEKKIETSKTTEATATQQKATPTPLDPEMCAYPFEIISEIIGARYSSWKPLTDAEKERIGVVMKPLFEMWFAGKDWAKYLIPLMTLGGVFLPRVMSIAKDGKEKKQQPPPQQNNQLNLSQPETKAPEPEQQQIESSDDIAAALGLPPDVAKKFSQKQLQKMLAEMQSGQINTNPSDV